MAAIIIVSKIDAEFAGHEKGVKIKKRRVADATRLFVKCHLLWLCCIKNVTVVSADTA